MQAAVTYACRAACRSISERPVLTYRFTISDSMVLHATIPAGYPSSDAPVVVIDAPKFRDKVASLSTELHTLWQEGAGEPCLFQWIEHCRTALDDAETAEAAVTASVLDTLDAVDAADAADLADAAAAVAAADAADVETEALTEFVFNPPFPKYGQRQKSFGSESGDPVNAVEIVAGTPFTDRKSTFQAFLAPVHSQAQVSWFMRALLENNKIARATHNMLVYRFFDDARGVQVSDNDDDGEDGAGSRLAQMLENMKANNVVVVVSRWFGGIKLGPDRFRHINNAARDLLEAQGYQHSGPSKGGKKKKGK